MDEDVHTDTQVSEPSDHTSSESDPEMEGIAFIGATLAPLFMGDPRTDETKEALAAFATLNPQTVASQWPFVDASVAQTELERMVSALALGVDDALVKEYGRLFIGPSSKPALVWGSVFTDKKGAITGSVALALHQWMEEQGIALATDAQMPEDHIGLTLALMSWIALNRPELLDEYLQNQFLPWAGHLLDAFADEADHPFYQGLARLSKASLDGIQKARNLEITYPKFYR